MDQISANISKMQIDSFSKKLDSSLVIDTTISVTFNIDTIKLQQGDFKMFTCSVTAIQTNGTTISRTISLTYNSVNNVAGSYFLKTQAYILVAGITGMTITPQLINNNTLCVIKITLSGGRATKIHYRRQEI
jgi:hypothetical protein